MTINEYVKLMKSFSNRIVLCDARKENQEQVVVCYGHMVMNNLDVTATNAMLFDKHGNAIGLWSAHCGEVVKEVLYKCEKQY